MLGLRGVGILALAIGAALLCCACQTVPFTGRNQLLLTSVNQENSLGDEAWKEVCAKEKVSSDASLNAALERVGRAIAAVADRPDFKWEFKVFESQEANAYCLPGGKVAVYTGILKYMDNDAELAAVVGHEVGHAIARHGGERMSQAMIQSAGQEVVSATVEGADDGWLVAYGLATNVGAILPYSRLHEYEADRLGMILMAKAGYDPRATISFWKKFAKAGSEGGAISEFLSTHPLSENRLEEMKKWLPEAMRFYESAPVKNGLGQALKAPDSQGKPQTSAAASQGGQASNVSQSPSKKTRRVKQ